MSTGASTAKSGRSKAPRTRNNGAVVAGSVLEAKLTPPPLRDGIIERTALLDRLDESREMPMLAVVAPAGYGKSTLLAQWRLRDRRPFIWLSVDQRDNDAGTLLANVAAAIGTATPLSPDLSSALSSTGPSVWAAAVPRVARTLRAVKHPVVVVLDDADLLTRPQAADVVIALAGNLGPGSQLVLAGRTTGRVPVPRLVAAGRLHVLEAADLALTAEEAARVLRAAGIEVSDEEAESLNRHAEGWPTGVYLTALAIRGRAETERPHPFGTLSSRLVSEYIRTEILDRLAPVEMDFLLKTSVLDRFCAPLCDAVTERSDAASVLDGLERSNLLLIPLDDRHEWFRYHEMLREHLSAELAHREPDSVRSLLSRAAAWHDAHGDGEAAFEYALKAGDVERAATQFVAIGQRAYNLGRIDSARRWCEALEELGAPARFPDVAATGACLYASQGDVAEAERWARMAEAPHDGEDPLARPMVAFERAMLCRHGVEQMAADAAYAAEHWPEEAPFWPGALALLGVAQAALGDERADATLAEAAQAAAHRGRAHGTVAIGLAQRATLAMARGDWRAAEEHANAATNAVMDNGHSEQMSGGVVDAVAARVALRRGQRQRAVELLAHAQRLRPLLSAALPWIAVRSRLDLAHAHLALADPAGARTLLAEVQDVLQRTPRMGNLVDEARALHQQVQAIREGVLGVSSLSEAELRLLPWLATHLTFREIGERLFVSQNTIRTQAVSIYRKLDATSRSEAINRAVEVGLIEPMHQFISSR